MPLQSSWPGLTRPSILRADARRLGLHHDEQAERHAEQYDDIRFAIQRETSLKRWRRSWKLQLIAASNPERVDLYETIN
ncbi:MAG TPA: hypothetical protein VGJ31_07520 [Dongiaceae bacterium]